MEKWYLFNVYTFCKSLCVINAGSPYGLQGDPIYISYLYDQMWLVGMCNELIDFSQLGSTWSANKECKAIACYVLIDFI